MWGCSWVWVIGIGSGRILGCCRARVRGQERFEAVEGAWACAWVGAGQGTGIEVGGAVQGFEAWQTGGHWGQADLGSAPHCLGSG